MDTSCPAHDPREHLVYVGVYTGDVGLSAPDSPRDQADDIPAPGVGLADQRRAPVAIARVLPLFPSRAQLAVAQGEGVGASGALASERAPQGFFTACAIRNERHVHLVLDELEGPVLAVLAPAGNPTPCAGSVAELVVEHVAALW